MAKRIDQYQEKVLDFFRENDGAPWTLREVGLYIDKAGVHPQKVSNKIQQLEKMGYLRKNFDTDSYDVIERPVKDVYYFPIYGYAQCGHRGASIAEERPQGTLAFSTAVLGISNPDRFFFVKAKGKSMEPLIHDGDLVLIRQQEDYDVGTRVLAVHNGQLKIKKVYTNDGARVLISDNPNVADLEIQPYDELKVAGVVKKVIRDIA